MTTMEYQRLGTTDLTVSRIALGTLAFGGHYGSIGRQQILRTIRSARETGVNFFDTSPSFGAGLAEEMLGDALRNEINEVVISTKIGGGIDSTGQFWFINSRTNVIRQVEESLRRLHRDVIDLYQIPGPDPNTPIHETMEALDALRRDGKIRYIGFAHPNADLLREALKTAHIDVVMIPYNILTRASELSLLPFCRATKIGVLACEPYLRGLLCGHLHKNYVFDEDDLRTGDQRFRGDLFRRNVENMNRLQVFAQDQRLSMHQLAIGWVLQNPLVSSAVCGAKSPGQILESSAAAAVRLTPEQFVAANQIIGEESFHHEES